MHNELLYNVQGISFSIGTNKDTLNIYEQGDGVVINIYTP